MRTITRLRPADHGRLMTLEDFEHADGESGWRFELIDGKVYVSPKPRPQHDRYENHLFRLLDRYAERRPKIIDYVTFGARVHVPGPRRATVPEPDLACYRGYPKDPNFGD